MRRLLIGSLIVLVLVLVALPALLARVLNTPTDVPVRQGADGSDVLPIKVYFPDTKKIQEMMLGDYLVGVVAAEMPNFFHDEALKAQFVVARTYAVRRMQQFVGPGRGGCPLEPKADVCADFNTGQAYVSRDDLAKREGPSEAAAYWSRLEGLLSETGGQVLRYGTELIDPLYHSVSGTKTEDSGSFFTHSLPYLKPVDDRWGAKPPQVQLRATVWFTPEELVQKLGAANMAVPALATAVKSGKPPITVEAYTDTGRVKSVKVLGNTFTGREVREKLQLKSTNFTVDVQEGRVGITTTGNGHGVGMSQWGAQGMAEAGKTYSEILLHYYTGVQLSRIFAE